MGKAKRKLECFPIRYLLVPVHEDVEVVVCKQSPAPEGFSGGDYGSSEWWHSESY